jgi:PAS domain S-box-containing protein
LRHLEQLMAQLMDGVILIDPSGTILGANTAALQMHGVEDAAALGSTAEEYAARFSLRTAAGKPLRQRDYPLFRLLAGEPFPDEVVHVAPAGEDEVRWVHRVRDVVMDEDGGEPDYLALVISDVSARFDAETRFDAMFRANPAPALVLRLADLRIVRANPGFLALTGFAEDQLHERPLFALDLLGGLADPAEVRRRIAGGEIVPQGEAELLVADGSRRLVLFAGQPIDVTGEDALLLTFADLEPRRRAERALAASERHLVAVFEMAPVAMAITRDTDHRIARVNAAFRDLTGHDDAAAIDRTFADLGLWDTPHETVDVTIADKGRLRGGEARLRRRDGGAVDVLVAAETIDVDGAACVLWAFDDVTERRRTETELASAIDEVMKDASWLSRSILDKLATLRRPQTGPPPSDLTPREREILDLICDDLDDPAIAARLGLSRNTVRNHIASIYAKTGVNRRSGAVVWGRERGMGSRRA